MGLIDMLVHRWITIATWMMDVPLPGVFGSPLLYAALSAIAFLQGLLCVEQAIQRGRRTALALAIFLLYTLLNATVAGSPPQGPPLTPMGLLWTSGAYLVFWYLLEQKD